MSGDLASLSPVARLRLRLVDNGYRPVPIRTWGGTGAGKAPYLRDWQKLTATAEVCTLLRCK